MKKSDYIGWQEVFRFSLVQGMKQKAYYGFLIFLSVVTILSMPVMSLIQSMDKEEEYVSEVTKLTIYDETRLGIDYSKALPQAAYTGVQIATNSGQTFESHVDALEESEDSTELLLKIVYEQSGYFNLTFVKAVNADLSDEDCQSVADSLVAFFDEARIEAIQVTKEQMDFVNQPVNTKVEMLTHTGEVVPDKAENEGISLEEYMVLLMGIMVVTMIISLSGSSIATSIVTEKSTRVVEYLMINVRPMALIVGKILASLLMVLIQFVVMGVCYSISAMLNLVLFGEATLQDTLQNTMQGAEMDTSALLQMVSQISLIDVIVAIVVILCGVLFYSILAGLAGASVSKMEEVAEGMKLFQMTMVIGAYLGIGLCIVLMMGGDNQVFTIVCSLIPISAPFVVPACLLIGKVSLGIALLSLVLLLVLTALLFSFTAKVYESMIFYNGSVMKFKDILQIAKNRKPVAGKEENHE